MLLAADTTAHDMLTAAQALNGITIVGIVISAVVGVFIYLNFYLQRQEYKLQRTMRLVDDFFNEKLDGKTTPCSALREGRRIAASGSLTETIFDLEADRYAVISSYFDKALFLYENRMLNDEYYLGRMWRAILRSQAEMKGLKELLKSRLPQGPSSMEQLAAPASEYASKHGLLRSDGGG